MFEIGDEVKVVSQDESGVTEGSIGLVLSVDQDEDTVYTLLLYADKSTAMLRQESLEKTGSADPFIAERLSPKAVAAKAVSSNNDYTGAVTVVGEVIMGALEGLG